VASPGQDRERRVGHELMEAIELFVDQVVEQVVQVCRSELARDGRQR
jgi:hypothetical protein